MSSLNTPTAYRLRKASLSTIICTKCPASVKRVANESSGCHSAIGAFLRPDGAPFAFRRREYGDSRFSIGERGDGKARQHGDLRQAHGRARPGRRERHGTATARAYAHYGHALSTLGMPSRHCGGKVARFSNGHPALYQRLKDSPTDTHGATRYAMGVSY